MFRQYSLCNCHERTGYRFLRFESRTLAFLLVLTAKKALSCTRKYLNTGVEQYRLILQQCCSALMYSCA